MVSNENIIITPGTKEERIWAAELLASSEPWITLGTTPDQCQKVCNDPEYLVYVAHMNGKPCGAMILHPRGLASSPYLKSIVVASEYRSRGIGAALLEFAENLFCRTARHLFLCVSSFNIRAMVFYERLGYKKVGEFKDYIINGESEILMHKRLR
jgi:ribosomal protein S18 acetylase RimI-like enzyme